MEWTRTPPSEPGYYWCYNVLRRLYMVFVEKNLFDNSLSVYALKDIFRYNISDIQEAYWQGPLQVPEKPEEQ